MKKSKVAVGLGVLAAVGSGAVIIAKEVMKSHEYANLLINRGCKILEGYYESDISKSNTRDRELRSFVECIKELNRAANFNITHEFDFGGGITEGVKRSLKAVERNCYLGTKAENQMCARCMKVVYNDENNGDKTQTEIEAYIDGCNDALEALKSFAMEENESGEVSEVAKYIEECKKALSYIKNKDEDDAYCSYNKDVRELLNTVLNKSEKPSK